MKTRSREEQIEAAGQEILDKMIPATVRAQDCFAAGAEWADANPIEPQRTSYINALLLEIKSLNRVIIDLENSKGAL